jgi:hypothetical protein
MYRDPEAINRQWGLHFKEVYNFSNCECFDTTMKSTIDEEISLIKNTLTHIECNTMQCNISVKEVDSACSRAKRNKACGADKCFYENYIHGGLVLQSLCAKLFSAMLRFSYTPIEMKKGVIISLRIIWDECRNKSTVIPNIF